MAYKEQIIKYALDPTVREIIIMATQVLMASATIILIFAIRYHMKAVKLQRESIQASMFSETSGRISVILGKIPSKGEHESEMINWYVSLFNEFEVLVFLKNNKYLSKNMEEYYRHFIIENVDRMSGESEEIKGHFEGLTRTTFNNLRDYYVKHSRKEFPF